MSGVWLEGGPAGSPWTRSCLRGPPGRQATSLPVAPNASCTDKSPFLPVSPAMCFQETVQCIHSVCVCGWVCVCVRARHKLPQRAALCLCRGNDHSTDCLQSDVSEQLIRLALSPCSGYEIHYEFRQTTEHSEVTSPQICSVLSPEDRKTHKLKQWRREIFSEEMQKLYVCPFASTYNDRLHAVPSLSVWDNISMQLQIHAAGQKRFIPQIYPESIHQML